MSATSIKYRIVYTPLMFLNMAETPARATVQGRRFPSSSDFQVALELTRRMLDEAQNNIARLRPETAKPPGPPPARLLCWAFA